MYPTFVVLAFRYTNTILNVWQDILYANQVVDSNVCSNCKIQKAYKKMWDTIQGNVLADLKEIRKQTNLKKNLHYRDQSGRRTFSDFQIGRASCRERV